MTFNSNRKAALAVTAGLVGALTLGGAAVAVAPAYADDAAQASAGLQWVKPSDAFSDGTATYYLKNSVDGASGTSLGGKTVQFTKGVPALINVTKMTFKDSTGESVDLTIDNENTYEIAYYKRGNDGKPTGDPASEVTEVGKYVAVVTVNKGTYVGASANIAFDITARPLSSATIALASDEFGFYDGEEKDTTVTLPDGTSLVEGVDYTVKYYVANQDTSAKWERELKDAGDYVAKITGIGNYAGTVELSSKITISQFDVNSSAAVVNFDPIVTDSAEEEPTAPAGVYVTYSGVTKYYGADSELVKGLKAEFKSAANGDDSFLENGAYTYSVTPADPEDANFVQGTSVDMAVWKVEELASFTYKGAAMADSYEVVKTDTDTLWNDSKVKASLSDSSKTVSVNQFSVDGTFGSSTVWQITPGKHEVTYIAMCDGAVVGKKTVTVTVYEDAVNADAKAIASFYNPATGKREVVNSVETVYSGTNLLSNAPDGKPFVNVYVEGLNASNYKATVYNENGTEVKSIVDAGTYTLKLVAPDYKLSGTTELTIKVAKKAYAGLTSGQLKTEDWGDKVASNDVVYLPWKKEGYGLEGVAYKHYGLNLKYDADGDGEAETALSSQDLSAYKVTFLKDGKEVKKIEDEGVYTVHFEARNTEYAKNYEAPADLTLTVIKDSHLLFADVAYTDYFADSVAWAVDNHVMHGYGAGFNAPTFGPMDGLTRAQVAGVLYNLASVWGKVETKPVQTPNKGYVTGFDDTDNFSWYAEAVAWAKQAGVVNGHDGKFNPDAKVTREDFACMLANYAKKFGSFEAPSADALDKMPDAAQVSGYARESVAWAVANKVMGNAGSVMPTATINRADGAGMVMNFAK